MKDASHPAPQTIVARNRVAAELAGSDRYEGSPCSKCQGTTRYVCRNECVNCKTANRRARYKKEAGK